MERGAHQAEKPDRVGEPAKAAEHERWGDEYEIGGLRERERGIQRGKKWEKRD